MGLTLSDPVRFALIVAGIAELLLHDRRLRCRRGTGGKVRARARKQERGSQRHHHRHLRLLLLREHARDVALGDVAQLMADYRRKLGLRVRDGDEARMHEHKAARKRECVDCGIAQQKELEVIARAGHDRRHAGRKQQPRAH